MKCEACQADITRKNCAPSSISDPVTHEPLFLGDALYDIATLSENGQSTDHKAVCRTCFEASRS